MEPAGYPLVAGQGGAEQVRVIFFEGGKKSVPSAGEADVIFNRPKMVVFRVRLEEQQHRQLDIAGIEIESPVVVVPLVRSGESLARRFRGITHGAQMGDIEQEEAPVVLIVVEFSFAIITENKNIKLIGTLFE